MTEILVFGGTSEGRELAEWLSARGTCEVVACSATELGGELVSGLPGVEALVGPLDAQAKEQLVAAHDFACIVDATHPYAVHVSQSLSALARAHGLPLLRLVRDVGEATLRAAAPGVGDEAGWGTAEGAAEGVAEGAAESASEGVRPSVVTLPNVEAAARYVAGCAGRVLLTTGSKDLRVFTDAMSDFAERLYARILPVPDSIAHAHELGIPAGHIVAMRGPFSTAFNCALMRELGIRVMVTKASGAVGGFPEKMEAARLCGVQAVVIDRPVAEEGLSAAEVRETLATRFGV